MKLLTPIEAVLNPTRWQQEVLARDYVTHRVLLNGRQSGKSTIIRQLIYSDSLSAPNQELLYVACTIGQAKEIMWRPLLNTHDCIFHPQWIKNRNNSERTIELYNGSRLTVTGSENVEALLGRTIDRLYLDEWQSQDPKVWEKLQPMLAARMGRVVFAGTARGFDDLYDKWWKGSPLNPDKHPDWYSWKIKTADSGTPAGLPAAIATAREALSPQQFAQEYEASPYSTEGLVYPDFDLILNTMTEDLITDSPVIHVGMDFNVDNMMAVVAIKKDGKLFVGDEIHLTHKSNTQTMIRELKARYGDKKIIVYPDASGRNRTTAADYNSTNHTLLEQAGFTLRFNHRGNPDIIDRVNTVNAVICNANQDRRLFVHRNCKNIINTLTKQTYHNGKPLKDGKIDHAGDALGYLVYQLFSIRANSTTLQTF